MVSEDELQSAILKSLRGEGLTPAEDARLREWLAGSPERGAELERLRATWDLLGRRVLDVPAWEPLRGAGRSRSGRVVRGRRGWLAVGVAGCAAALWGLLLLRPPGGEVPGAAVYVAGGGEAMNLRLEDGTLVRLGPGGRLEVAPGSGGREVELRGRAFFAVAPRSAARFRIRAPGGDVSVLGTRFDVHAEGDRVELVVVDGRVELSAGADTVEVEGGEASRAEGGAVAPPERVEDVFALLAWMDHGMVFHSTPLGRVAEEVGRRFGVEVEVAPALRGQAVTAAFAGQPLEEVVEVVCRAVNAECEVDPARGRVAIRPRASGAA